MEGGCQNGSLKGFFPFVNFNSIPVVSGTLRYEIGCLRVVFKSGILLSHPRRVAATTQKGRHAHKFDKYK